MAESSPTIFFNFFIFLFIPFVLGFTLRKFKLPPLIGYILGGIIIGNFASGLVTKETINSFAFFGIVLLLFTVGLEINLEKISVLKKFILTAGLLQIGLSILFISIASFVFKFNLLQSFLIGIALSSSSTTLVAKLIQERGEDSSFFGELAIGILMLQDLAFIPFIIIFSFLNNTSLSAADVVKNILIGTFEAGIILFSIYYFGRRVVPFIFNKVAIASRELLNLFIILFIFFVGFVASSFGVPTLIGAFVAGILVSQTLEHYHIFSQIRPFRDITAIIFFVYIGSSIKLAEMVSVLPQTLLFALIIILIKLLIVLAVFIYLKFSTRIAFSFAVFLFQVSENAFILISLAYANKHFNSKEYMIIIGAVLITLIVTPLLIQSKDKIYFLVRKFLKKNLPVIENYISNRLDFNRLAVEEINLENHVIICGYGRIGSFLGRALNLSNIPFIAVDYNFYAVSQAKKEGINIVYGDPTDIDILDYIQAEKAAVIVSAVPDIFSQEAIILNTKKLNPRALIICRVHQHEHKQRVKNLGVDIVIQPELEASIAIIKKIMVLKGISKEEMILKLKYFRVEQSL